MAAALAWRGAGLALQRVRGSCGMDAGGVQGRGLAREAVGRTRIIAFGTSIVAPSASAATVLVLMMASAGFASPLVVLITFAGSLCCAFSIGQFAGRVPSAGWAYTYNSRGLGPTAGFLTGWMMAFAYALFVPAGIGLTSAFTSQLLASTLHVNIAGWVLFVIIGAAGVLVAYLGISTSSSVDLILVAGEMAVIVALAVTVLVKTAPAHYSVAALSPASSPHQRLSDITDAMIYAITAFAGFEAAAALGEEARDTRRSVPASIIGIVVVTGIFYLLVACAVAFGAGRDGIGGLVSQPSPLGFLTSQYWSPSVRWLIDLVIALAGLGFVVATLNAAVRVLFTMGRERALSGSLARLSQRQTPVVAIGYLAVITLMIGLPLTYVYGGVATFGYLAMIGSLPVVLIYLAVNVAVIRAFRTEFRSEFRPGRHLLIPAVASLIFLFPLWGILFPGPYTLVNLLPFIAFGWLAVGAVAAAVLRTRRPAIFGRLGRVAAPEDGSQLEPDLKGRLEVLTAAVGAQPVQRHDVQGDDGQGPERIGRDEEHLVDGVEPDDHHGEPSG
jgi:amino acid transporter